MDFVMTIEDDNEVISLEEENSDINDDTQINNTKAKKTNKKDKKANKKENKKLNNEKNNEKNKRDDKNNINSENDIINPEFTFFIDGINNKPIEHPWDFNAARAGLKPKIPVKSKSIDEIIENKRLEAKKKKNHEINGNDKNDKKKMNYDDDELSESEKDDDLEKKYIDRNKKKETMKHDEVSEDDRAENDEEEEDSDEDEPYTFASNSEDSNEDDNEYERERKKAYFADKSEIIQNEDAESFQTMNLSRPILKGLSQLGFIQPTQIQKETIPIALMGKDICGGAITGSGKTIAFLVPIIERLFYRPRQTAEVRVLILAPTRELTIQCHSVASKLAAFTDITLCLCVGGLSLKQQETELRARPDIVIATPGRLIDHVRNSPSFLLESIEILVIDEADRMLEVGFADELNEIVKYCPKSRQTMLFSATMTDNVDELIRLSLNRPVKLMIDSIKSTNTKLIQEFIRIREYQEKNREIILLILCKKYFKHKVIIFFRTKSVAHEMKVIFGLLGLKASELHGNLSQEQRLEALEAFRDGKVDYLLATDLASRGLDIKGIETVINYDIPQSYDQYIHRVGRTARAGRNGRSVTLTGESDRKLLKLIIKHSQKEQIKKRKIDVELIKEYSKKLEDIKEKVEEVLKEEKEEKLMNQAEMELLKGQNLLKYENEIFSRPARTWFQSEKEKKLSKNLSADNIDAAFAVVPKNTNKKGKGAGKGKSNDVIKKKVKSSNGIKKKSMNVKSKRRK
ncbi:17702_t:CDS:10 [Rhizophagus irregularis]|nr:17702_t:CDS:10 [Rhizophagus irregularis]